MYERQDCKKGRKRRSRPSSECTFRRGWMGWIDEILFFKCIAWRLYRSCRCRQTEHVAYELDERLYCSFKLLPGYTWVWKGYVRRLFLQLLMNGDGETLLFSYEPGETTDYLLLLFDKAKP